MMRRVVLGQRSARRGRRLRSGWLQGPIYTPQPIVTGDFELGLGRLYPAAGPSSACFTGAGRANMPVRDR